MSSISVDGGDSGVSAEGVLYDTYIVSEEPSMVSSASGLVCRIV